MSLRDRDLISIQEARELAARAAAAQKKFAAFSQEQVDAIVEACAKAAAENAEPLGARGVEETGFGNVPDKIVKNTLAAVNVPRAIRGMRTVGILREDREKGIVEVASPVGVVAAVIPSTNPTSTAIYKTLISIKAQNAIVLSPHPSAIKCICQAATLLERAALTAGAPEGLIQCMKHTTLGRHTRTDAASRSRRDSGHGRHGAGARGVRFGKAGLRRWSGECSGVHRAHRRCAQGRRGHHRRKNIRLRNDLLVRAGHRGGGVGARARAGGMPRSRAHIFFPRRKPKKSARAGVSARHAHAEYENRGPRGDRDRRRWRASRCRRQRAC